MIISIEKTMDTKATSELKKILSELKICLKTGPKFAWPHSACFSTLDMVYNILSSSWYLNK